MLTRMPSLRLTCRLTIAALMLALSALMHSTSHAQPADTPDAAQPASTPDEEGEPLLPEADAPDSLDSLTKKYPEVNEAVEKFKARDMEAALQAAQAAAAKHSELPPGEVLVAGLHFAARDVNGALLMLDKAVVAHPDDPSAYLDLANIAILQNRKTESTLLLAKASEVVKAFDANAERKKKALDRLAQGYASLHEKKEEWKLAEQYLEKLAKEKPDKADFQIRYARALFRNKKGKSAYEHLSNSEAVKSAMPAAASPSLTIAQFYAETKDFDSASKWINYAVKQKPRDLPVRLAALQWNWQRGNAEDVKKHAIAAIEIDPASIPARIIYGMYAHYAGDLNTAVQQFEAVLTRSPNHFGAKNSLARVLADRADADSMIRAKRLAEENLQANSSNLVAAGTLGWTHFKLGQYEDAAKLLQAVSQSGGLNDRDNIYFLARVADRAGQREQAVKLLKQVLDQPQLFEMRGAAEKWMKSVDGGANKQ